MAWFDSPAAILTQDAARTRLADDCEMVQRLVADAERTWERAVEAGRRRAAGVEIREFSFVDGRKVVARMDRAEGAVPGVESPPQLVFETAQGTQLGSVSIGEGCALQDFTTDELRRMLRSALEASRE